MFRERLERFVAKHIAQEAPAPPSNCAGFVYWKLGLWRSDTYKDPGTQETLEVSFDFLDTPVGACALAIVTTDNRNDVLHIALIDPEDSEYLIHRRGYYMPVEKGRITDCLQDFDFKTGLRKDGKQKVLYLKIKYQ